MFSKPSSSPAHIMHVPYKFTIPWVDNYLLELYENIFPNKYFLEDHNPGIMDYPKGWKPRNNFN